MLGLIDLTEMKTEGRCGEKREILAENKKNASSQSHRLCSTAGLIYYLL
jgi:hypothetical protein